MKTLVTSLWHDEAGFIISAELVVIATLLVIGLITGLACVQGALIEEFRDLAFAFSSLNQSFVTSGFTGCWTPCGIRARTFGSFFFDRRRVGIAACPVDFVGAWGVGIGSGVAFEGVGIGGLTGAAAIVPGAVPCPTGGCLTSPCPVGICPDAPGDVHYGHGLPEQADPHGLPPLPPAPGVHDHVPPPPPAL